MRIDVLLKSLCFVKTRNQGQKGCEEGFVKLNGRVVKPGREVQAGDILEIRYPKRLLVVEITEVPPGQVSRKERERFFSVVREEHLTALDEWDL
jgi:ribosomal 50S subunit-recycling heat shock protein